MNGRITGSIALAAFVLFAGSRALAQDAPAAPAAANAPQPAAPADTAAPASGATAPAAPDATKKSNNGGVMGFAYREHPAMAAGSPGPVHHHARMVRHANEALAKVSGFEMLADGGSRLFVQLSKQIDVEQAKEAMGAAPRKHANGKHAKSAKQAAPTTMTQLTFVLKGTELGRYNDGNSLETMHFNTPVVRARLVPAGHDVRFVVLLRADVTPTMKVVPAKDNGAMLQIDFPQGAYVTPAAVSPADMIPTNEPVNGALPFRPAGAGETPPSSSPPSPG